MLSLVGLVLCLVPVDTLTAFPPKCDQVGKLNGDVVVQCDTLEPHISWTLNGEQEPMAELVAEGQNLTILGLDLPATGNYSCWAGPVLLDTTYVVVSSTYEEEIDVTCQAESYYGSFHCSWPGPPSAIFRARLTHSDGSVGLWVPVAGGHGQFSISLADPSFCPFGEELRPLQLHLEGLSDTSYLSLSRHFFLRDIVRPDPPQELTLRWQGEQLHLAWAPPASWQLPKSYFSLLYHLQYELPNGTQVTPHAPTLPQPGLFPAQPWPPPHSSASLLEATNCHPWLSPLLPQLCPPTLLQWLPPTPRICPGHDLPPLQVERFVEGVEETQVQVGAQRVRISCRDPYTPPAWSPWSPWQDLNAPQ
ncbi:interleukin-12 subunit beta-like [Myiozetetes cayanensis]|uniref:interleukin-12 subunit beta-like n=1 Tax=Myiozetetes cayanensis TaxID=478635 RepID=UPI00215E7E4C|nr:interleukin-12 subunit beta-like [Myiozetetes cayanensis]